MHVNENRVNCQKNHFYLTINIGGSIDLFFILLFIEMAMYQWIIFHHALCHQHKFYATYVLCKEKWHFFQNDYMDEKLHR